MKRLKTFARHLFAATKPHDLDPRSGEVPRLLCPVDRTFMKTIAETVSLEGQREEITISELRSKPGEVFAQVALGKVFAITKLGRVIAEIKSPEPEFDFRALNQLRKMTS